MATKSLLDTLTFVSENKSPAGADPVAKFIEKCDESIALAKKMKETGEFPTGENGKKVRAMFFEKRGAFVVEAKYAGKEIPLNKSGQYQAAAPDLDGVIKVLEVFKGAAGTELKGAIEKAADEAKRKLHK